MVSGVEAHIPLRIERLPDGGFMVSEAPTPGDHSRYCGARFASTSIVEALEFIARRLDPAALEALRAAQAEAAKSAEAAAAPVRCSRCGSAGVRRYCSRCHPSTNWMGA